MDKRRADSLAYRTVHLLLVLCACTLSAIDPARGTDQPDQLITGKLLIIKTNSSDSSKNKLVFASKDSSFDLPSVANDPQVEGAILKVIDLGPGGGSVTIPLIPQRWSATGGGFKYRGQSGDPCKTVKIRDDKLVKAVCKGASVALTLPFSGSAAVGLIVGNDSIRYCTTFGGDTIRYQQLASGKRSLKSKNAPAPLVCLTCGDGNVDLGEQCDDGNNTSGDCCSAGCQFEPNSSPCNDGDSCTLNDACNGAGACGGGPTCGNNAVDAGCGEQCDGSADSACPGRCQGDCTCLPLPTCDVDPTRTFFAGGPETSACHQFDGNQTLCEQAFLLGGGGVTSCWYDIDSDDCSGCGPTNQAEGLCMNACRPVSCVGDPSRMEFAGGPQSSACLNFGLIAGTAACETAFHIGAEGVASCYYDAGLDECRGCGAQNQADGNCTNTCAACPTDPSRTIFAGGPGTQACHQFDGDQASCEQAFHRDQCGNDVSCYYDNGSCNGCGPFNESEGECRNTCAAGPITCTNDPSRTIDAGGPFTAACHQFDGDPVSCQQAFHRTDCNQPTSCYYDFSFDACQGCGPNNEQDGQCINTCVAGPVTCTNDSSRTLFAGMPGSGGCGNLGQVLGTAACETAFIVGDGGLASCFTDGSDCYGCGPPNESNGQCRNTCVHGAPTCDADPSRTVFAGGPGTQACHQFDGDQASCESAFHLGQCGVASCFYDFGSCNGCGPNNQQNGDCTNTCVPATCPGDASRTIFAGGPQSGACHFFDGNQTLCEKAFHLGAGGVASCFYDSDADECLGCGPSNQENGDCLNSCPVCFADSSRTVFAGGPNTQACHQFDGNQAACESAFHYDQCGEETSCYYSSGDCQGCGPNNLSNFECQNTCVAGPPVCEKDQSRTIFLGGPNTSACHQFDADPVSCHKAFHRGQSGIASCFYDSSGGECVGCGPNNQSGGECLNTCLHGVPACSEDPSRTVFAGGPDTAACHLFDGNQQACESTYHLDQCRNATSCYYDVDFGDCNGCGPNHLQNGDCVNTCRTGPASCDLDPSRILFGGGPGTQACQQYGDAFSCLAAFHVGQCGVASCFWDGSCQGCGPSNELSAQCFNTCNAP